MLKLTTAKTERRNAPKVQIFATDVNERSLVTARRGSYPQGVAPLPPALEPYLHRGATTQDVIGFLRHGAGHLGAETLFRPHWAGAKAKAAEQLLTAEPRQCS